MQTVTPQIFHLAGTTVDFDKCSQFLAFHNVSQWTTDTGSDASRLTEMAGRRCYQAWEDSETSVGEINPNLSKVRKGNEEYIANILNSGHGSVLEHASETYAIENVTRVFCYHPEVEVLTEDGWKQVQYVSTGEKVLTLNPTTGLARWSINQETHSFDYVGQLLSWQDATMKSPPVTPDHLMWVRKYDVRRDKKNWMKVPAKDMLQLGRWRGRYDIIMESSIDNLYITIGEHTYNSDLFFKWLGLVASDGHVKDNRNSVNIVQRKTENVKMIRDLCQNLFADRIKEYNYNHAEFRVSDKALKDFVIKTLGGRLKRSRNLAGLTKYNSRLIWCFLNGFFIGDGSTHATAAGVVYTSCYETALGLQVLYAMIGISCNIRKDDRVGVAHYVNGTSVEQTKPGYIVSLHSRRTFLYKSEKCKKLSYAGKVFCPRTEDGLVYVRWQGRAIWSGNTHEVVRHRLCAFSQESLRFVRPTSLRAYFPDVFKDLPPELASEVSRIFGETFTHLELIQKALVNRLGMDTVKRAFGEKKKLQSAMRRLMPIGMATGIIVTSNHRNWRHMIEMRTSRHAEEEIRLVFGMIAWDLLERHPEIYQDIEIVQVRGEPSEYVFTNKKV